MLYTRQRAKFYGFTLVYSVLFYHNADDDCDEPDCPGDPNCNARGTCDISYDPPIWLNCDDGWFGPACDDICYWGEANATNTECMCNTTCYHGPNCNIECSG